MHAVCVPWTAWSPVFSHHTSGFPSVCVLEHSEGGKPFRLQTKPTSIRAVQLVFVFTISLPWDELVGSFHDWREWIPGFLRGPTPGLVSEATTSFLGLHSVLLVLNLNHCLWVSFCAKLLTYLDFDVSASSRIPALSLQIPLPFGHHLQSRWTKVPQGGVNSSKPLS